MNFYTKTLLTAAMAAVMGAAVAADVQTVVVKTGAGQDIRITTQDDGTLVVTDGTQTLSGTEAVAFLEAQGVVITVSSTGTILGLTFKDNAGTVTQKPEFVKGTTETVESAPAAAAVVMPANDAVTSTLMSQTFNTTTGSTLGDKPVSR